MGQYSESPGTGDLLPNGQSKIIVGKIIAIQVFKKHNIQHVATLAIHLFSCAPNLKHCRIVLGFEKFFEFHCIFCTSCKDVHSRYFQAMSSVAIFPSNSSSHLSPSFYVEIECTNLIIWKFYKDNYYICISYCSVCIVV